MMVIYGWICMHAGEISLGEERDRGRCMLEAYVAPLPRRKRVGYRRKADKKLEA